MHGRLETIVPTIWRKNRDPKPVSALLKYSSRSFLCLKNETKRSEERGVIFEDFLNNARDFQSLLYINLDDTSIIRRKKKWAKNENLCAALVIDPQKSK